MPQYLMMIYDIKAEYSEQEEAELYRAHGEFGRANAEALRGGEELYAPATATSVRPDCAGGFTVTDGPFTETKEVLGGYYVVEAPDLDAAVAIAKQIPMSAEGGIEVRPIRTMT